MTKIDLVRAEMVQALKNKDKMRKDALSALLNALKAKFIDKQEDLTEEEENAIVLREIKQAQETIETVGRDEVIEECRQRIAVFQEFAPVMMQEPEIRETILGVFASLGLAHPSQKEKGLVMKHLMPLVKGKADGGLVNRIVGEMLQ